jgi:hypothetical protein
MKELGVKYGIGIDSSTIMVFELHEFPKHTIRGHGIVEIKKTAP